MILKYSHSLLNIGINLKKITPVNIVNLIRAFDKNKKIRFLAYLKVTVAIAMRHVLK